MAKFISPFEALNEGKGLSGTLGGRVYSSWKGISYSRSKPISVKNPRTPGQLAQRARIGIILKFLNPCIEFVRIGFQIKAKNMSAFNYATSFLYKKCVNRRVSGY